MNEPNTEEKDEDDLGETLRRVFVEIEPLSQEHRMRVLRAAAILCGTDIEEVS